MTRRHQEHDDDDDHDDPPPHWIACLSTSRSILVLVFRSYISQKRLSNSEKYILKQFLNLVVLSIEQTIVQHFSRSVICEALVFFYSGIEGLILNPNLKIVSDVGQTVIEYNSYS